MHLVICPLEFNVEKFPSKLQQERIISTVDRYKHVVRFCEHIFDIYVLPYGPFKEICR